MNVHVLQHVPFEGLGSIQRWLEARGAGIHYVRLFANDAMPRVRDVDLLIAMGGPMSVNDEAEWPGLAAEKQLVRDVIAADVPVLGICLGAQLIASALGARVYRNAQKEIGWFPVRSTGPSGEVFPFPSESLVFHWHGETFDLPPGATHLARSEGCVNQAFQLKGNVIGLQFHPEMTPEGVRAIIADSRPELRPARYVQSERDLLAAPAERYERMHGLIDEVLAYLVGRST